MTEPLSRSAALTGYADLVRAMGLDPFRLMREEGLSAAALSIPDLKVPAEAVGRLFERTATLSGAGDFGLRLAETRRLSNLGAVAFVLREQPNLRKAIEAMVSYTWVQNQAMSLRLEEYGDTAILRSTVTALRTSAFPQSLELSFGVITLTLRRLTGGGWRPREVWFAHPRPPDVSTHRRVFGTVPLFDQDFDGLVLEAADLAMEISGADPEAARRAELYLALEARAPRGDVAAAVRELIVALLPTGACTIEKTAAHLGVSRRTLHRQLAEAGVTFTGLLEETRVELVRRRLESGRHSLTEIAEQVGYGSLSAFSRWLRTRRELVRPRRIDEAEARR